MYVDSPHRDERLWRAWVAALGHDEFAAVCADCDEVLRPSQLGSLAPYLPKALFPDALAAACAISDELARASALVGLAPYLPETLLPDALAAARAISDETPRAYAMVRLAPHLPETLLPDALAAVCAISDETPRAYALDAIKIAGKKKETGPPYNEDDPNDVVDLPPEKEDNTNDLSRTDAGFNGTTELPAPSAEKDFMPREDFEEAQGEATAPAVARALQWPTEKWMESPEKMSRRLHGIVAFLRRVWKPFIDENNLLVTRAMLAERDPDAGLAVESYVRRNPLPDDIRIVRTRDISKIQARNATLLYVC